jgi:hypothetical protein
MLSSTLPENSTLSCGTDADAPRRSASGSASMGTPSSAIEPDSGS